MKSFKFYLRHEATPPEKLVEDYSTQEITDLQAEIARRISRRRKHVLLIRVMIGMGALCVLFTITFLRPLPLWVSGTAGLFSLVVITYSAVFARLPPCPACHNELDQNIGPFCPECGSTSVLPGSMFQAPRCPACGVVLRNAKVRGYCIRACTNCGVMLDDEGV